MPLITEHRRLTRDDYKELKILVAELERRGIPIPDELKIATGYKNWPKDFNGYFVRKDGRKYNPTQQQDAFINDTSRFAGFVGGRGSGKSSSSAQKALRKIEKGESGAVLNPDFENFKISTWPELREWIPWEMVVQKHRYRRHPSWTPTQPFNLAFANGVTVICKGLKNPDAARGPNINWLWYDEAQRDPDGLSWKIANASVRIGIDPQSWASYTPNGKLHWTYEFFEERNIPEEILKVYKEMVGDDRELVSVYHGTIDDNKDNLSPDFYTSMHALYGHGWLKAQELDGMYVDQGGVLGDLAWFNGKVVFKAPDNPSAIVRYWDLAGSEKKISGKKKNDPDETVGTLMSYYKMTDNFYIQHQAHGHWEWSTIKEMILQTAQMDGPYVPIYVEQEPAAGGKNQVAELQLFIRENLPGHTLRGHRPEGDKIMRANIWFAEAKEGKIYLVQGEWLQGFMDQFASFPEARHDDRVDSVSGARVCVSPIRKWRKIKFLAVKNA